jgi:hypothetical protein
MTTAHDLSARLADLLRHERQALAEFLVALAEFDRERVWVELGHASLFSYLHRDLGLSKGAVGSTGRRNDALQLSRWCIEGERLPGSLVEPQRNCIELLLRKPVQ